MKVLDLFCGAGGFSSGFAKSGFEVTGVDIQKDAEITFRSNVKGKFINADLSRTLVKGNYNIVIGGPPCRPWSSVNTTRRGKTHKDYALLSVFFKHVITIKPKMFILENVPLLNNQKTLQWHINHLSKTYGYDIRKEIITYSDYGASTKRRRLIVSGVQKSDSDYFFDVLSTYKKQCMTVKDVIWSLRSKTNGEVRDHQWPNLNTIYKYMEYYKSGKFGWYILKWEQPAPSFGNVMKTYILHPDSLKVGKPRVISVKEAGLIMGFGEKFLFSKDIGLGRKYQMIVDSVSPVVSYAMAKAVKDLI